jgi:hypothetical protein
MFAIFKMAAKKRYKNGGKNSTLSDIIKIDMWVDNDVPTLNNFYPHFYAVSWQPF